MNIAIYFDTIGFIDPENGGLAVKIKFLRYLEAEILTKTDFMAAIFKNPRWRPYKTRGKW